MSKLRRYYSEGNIYFVTSVTYHRNPILVDNIDLLRDAFRKAKSEKNFEIIASVILPDHCHLLINPKKSNLSDIIKRIKLSFSASYRYKSGLNRGRVWQYRFWDHIIRDEEDLRRHMDYIHYNPVKHGFAQSPFDYSFSSIHDYRDYYQPDWGNVAPIEGKYNFGE